MRCYLFQENMQILTCCTGLTKHCINRNGLFSISQFDKTNLSSCYDVSLFTSFCGRVNDVMDIRLSCQMYLFLDKSLL